MDKVMDALDSIASGLANLQLKVGFIDGATYPDGTPVSLAAAVGEFGDIENNQPARPYFRNTISENEGKWQESIEQLSSNGIAPQEVLSLLGEVIADDIRGSIIALVSPPLSPVTIKKKGFDKPLIEHGIMLNSVSYEVGEIEPSTDS